MTDEIAPGGMSVLAQIEETKKQREGILARARAFRSSDTRDLRDPGKLGAALLALRRRAPKAPLSALYDRHEATLTDGR